MMMMKKECAAVFCWNSCPLIVLTLQHTASFVSSLFLPRHRCPSPVQSNPIPSIPLAAPTQLHSGHLGIQEGPTTTTTDGLRDLLSRKPHSIVFYSSATSSSFSSATRNYNIFLIYFPRSPPGLRVRLPWSHVFVLDDRISHQIAYFIIINSRIPPELCYYFIGDGQKKKKKCGITFLVVVAMLR